MSSPLPPLSRLVLAQDGQNLVRIEALRAQVAKQTLELAVVGDALAAAQPFLQSGREQRIGIEILEDLVHGFRGNRLSDAGRLDLLKHPPSSSTTARGLGSRNRAGDALVVDAALGLEPGDGFVDGVLTLAALGQTLADLRFRELAPGEHVQGDQIRVVGHDLSLPPLSGGSEDPPLRSRENGGV